MIKAGIANQKILLKSRIALALSIFCLIGLAAPNVLSLTANGVVTKASKIEFEPRISGVANLIYQVDCLAEINDTPLEAWRELWHKRLGWSAANDAQLNRWQQIRQKYLRTISVEPEIKEPFAYLPDDLVFRVGKLNLGDKLKISGLRAASLDDYQRSLELLVTVVEAAELKSILVHFEPRFNSWWKAGAEKAMQDFAAQMKTQVKEKSLNEFCARVALFYGAELPEQLTIPVNLIARPQTTSTDATATVIENQGLVEIIPGEDSVKPDRHRLSRAVSLFLCPNSAGKENQTFAGVYPIKRQFFAGRLKFARRSTGDRHWQRNNRANDRHRKNLSKAFAGETRLLSR